MVQKLYGAFQNDAESENDCRLNQRTTFEFRAYCGE